MPRVDASAFARKAWKTLLESNRPFGVRRMKSPSPRSNPSATSSAIAGDKVADRFLDRVDVTPAQRHAPIQAQA